MHFVVFYAKPSPPLKRNNYDKQTTLHTTVRTPQTLTRGTGGRDKQTTNMRYFFTRTNGIMSLVDTTTDVRIIIKDIDEGLKLLYTKDIAKRQ